MSLPNDDGPPPPPPRKPAAPPPPSDEEVVEAVDGDEIVEELDGELLSAEVADVAPVGALALAIEEARAAARGVEGGFRRRMEIYERELAALAAHAGEHDKALGALYQHEIGELLEEGGDEGAAVKAYAKALQSDATLKPNLWAIRRVFERRALWPNLLKLLDAEIRFARSDGERAELYVDKGRLLEERVGDAAGARDCYKKACAAQPMLLAAWSGLERFAAREGDLAELYRVGRGLADATPEPARKVALLVDLARLRASMEGGSLDEALALCREAAAVGVDTPRALDELERLAQAGGRNDELVAALEARIAHLAGLPADVPLEPRIAETVALRRRQAQLSAGRDDDKAWGCLEAALKLAPADPLIARDFARLAEARGRPADLAALLGRLTDGAPPETRAAIELERADALARAGQAAEAEAARAQVAKEAPGHLGLLIAREREALAAGDWDALVHLYYAEAELAGSPQAPTGQPDLTWTATALTQAGELLGERLAREPEAARALGQALVLVPGFRLAVDALERLYTRTGKHAELAALLEKELEGQPDAARAFRLYEALIAVREVGLDDAAGAAAAARRLVELRPDDLRARLRLVELDRAAARWAEAAEDLAALAKVVPDERRVEVVLERAAILERHVGDDAAAAAAYREALTLRPGEPRAVEAFEALSRRRAGPSGVAAGAARATSEVSPRAWEELAAALRREAEASLSPDRIAAVLLKLGEIHERERRNFEDAAQTYRDLLDKAPGNAAALRGLERAYAALGDEARRADSVEQEIDLLEPGAHADALAALGELYEDRLKKDDLADDAYGRAVSAGGSAHAALGRFRTAVRKREPAPIASALGALGELVGEGEPADPTAAPGASVLPGVARAALADELAAVERWAGNGDQALVRLKEAVAADDAARLPWMQWARLAARERHVADLAAAHDALVTRATDPGLRAALGRRAGVLALAGGGEAAAQTAAGWLKQAHALAASDPAVLVPLCDLTVDAEALAARVELASGAAQVEWLVEHGEALEQLGHLGDAARAALRALELDAHHLGALELCRRVARLGGDPLGLGRASCRLADELGDAERAAALYAEAGAIFEREGRRDDAAAAFRAVLDRTPLDGPAFARARALLVARYAETREASPLVELYGHRLEHAVDAAERIDLRLARAELSTQEGDRAAAERDLRAVLEIDEAQPQAMQRLADLVAAAPRGRPEAIRLMTRYLEHVEDGVLRRHALLRLADFEDAPGGRSEAALGHLERALEIALGPVELERLADLYTRLHRWPEAVATLARLTPLAPTGAARAAVELRIAAIERDGRSDLRASADALRRALDAQPLELEALARLMSLVDAGHLVHLEVTDRLDRAADQARADVAANPLDAAPYQALSRLWGWKGDEDARVLMAQAHAMLAGHPPPPREGAVEPTRELSQLGWERLLPEAARAVALDVWRLASEAANKIYGPELSALGVGKGDRVNAKGAPVAWIPVDKIARALGCAGYELYVSSRPDECSVVGSALVCGQMLADRLTPATRFRVARRLALLRDRLGPLERLDDDELTLLFAACARVAELPRPPSLVLGPLEAKLEERTRLVGKAMGRKERKGLQALGARFAQLGDPAAWRRAILDGAARVALVVSGDLVSAFAELGLDVRRDAQAQGLLQLATTEDYLSLRREMGLRG
jgi:tetratricopeptide (TPR) repeat protein